jgi:organic radical activating enzyme
VLTLVVPLFSAASLDVICGAVVMRIAPVQFANSATPILWEVMVLAVENLTTHKTLRSAIEQSWKSTSAGPQQRYVVFTGGEPLLQLDEALISALHQKGFEVAIETSGTRFKVPKGVDWVCVSPKAGSELIVLQANELKLVVPQVGHDALEKCNVSV